MGSVLWAMAIGGSLLVLGALLGVSTAEILHRVKCDPPTNETIYQFNATTVYGNETVTFDQFKGKAVLVFNVATYWGLTSVSYIQINALKKKFPELVVLGYPCNQFGMQEPYATPEELMNGIRWVRPGGNFDPQLDYFFEKSEVNGENELPIYTYMKGACGPTFSQFSKSHRLFYEPMRVGDIAWNFEKFLIDREGRPYARYHPHLVDPEHKDMLADIRAVLNPPTMTQEREPKSRFSQFTDNVRNLFNKR